MDHHDHVALLREGILGSGMVWADFGSGDGAFTLALAELLGAGGRIYSVDRDGNALERQAQALRRRFPHTPVTYRRADFTDALGLPPLDGIVIANALHFTAEKKSALRIIRAALRPAGRLVLVEYNTDHGNRWVPYPFSYPTWQALAEEAGFVDTRLVATRPSRFLGQIYAAVSSRPAVGGEGPAVR